MLRSFDQLQHLLPRGRAWSLIAEKALRRFFVGLSGISKDVVEYNDLAYLDLFPPWTRRLDQWEQQFNLPDVGLTDAERRSRLLGAWRAVGGQSPGYIQDTLRAAGFPVYVYDWFDDNGAARNPALVIRSDGTVVVYAGELGDTLTPNWGRSRSNSGTQRRPEVICWLTAYSRTTEQTVEYSVSSDTDTWTHYIYIGGETFGSVATLDPKRRDEFEELILSLKPAQTWVGVLVEYGALNQNVEPSPQVL